MSGLVVRPGDVLVVPIAPSLSLDSGECERLAAMIQAYMPQVRVLVAEGIAGGPFVYRPDPAFIAMTDAEIDALPDDVPKIAEAMAARLRRIREAQQRVEQEVPEARS